MILPLNTWFGSPAEAGAVANMTRTIDATKRVRRLIVFDATRSRLQDRTDRVESRAVGSIGSVDSHRDLDGMTRKRAIELSYIRLLAKCIEMTLNGCRVATSNWASQSFRRALGDDVA